MAPVARKRGKKDRSEFDFHTVLQWMKSLFLDPKNTWIIGLGLFCAEIVANILVVWKIRCEFEFVCFINYKDDGALFMDQNLYANNSLEFC